MSTCSFDLCERPIRTHGLCNAHYGQKWNGRELTPILVRSKNDGPCAYDPCDLPAYASDLCNSHYRMKRTGEPLRAIGCQPWTAQRVLDESVPMGDCLRFRAGTSATGYVTVRYQGKVTKAHRLVYSEFNGPIPPGAPIHHKCGDSYCIRPEHLQLASAAENTLEMLGRKAYEATITALEARVNELEAQLEAARSVIR